MNDTIVGVIIGGTIAFLASLISQVTQYKIESYKVKKESRKTAYINALKWFNREGTSYMDLLKEETYQIWEDATIGMNLYGSKKALKAYYKIENTNPPDENDKIAFKMQIESELGFKFERVKK